MIYYVNLSIYDKFGKNPRTLIFLQINPNYTRGSPIEWLNCHFDEVDYGPDETYASEFM